MTPFARNMECYCDWRLHICRVRLVAYPISPLKKKYNAHICSIFCFCNEDKIWRCIKKGQFCRRKYINIRLYWLSESIFTVAWPLAAVKSKHALHVSSWSLVMPYISCKHLWIWYCQYAGRMPSARLVNIHDFNGASSSSSDMHGVLKNRGNSRVSWRYRNSKSR